MAVWSVFATWAAFLSLLYLVGLGISAFWNER